MDNRVIVPLTTAMRRLFNIDYLGQIRVQFKDREKIERSAQEIRVLLRERHGLLPGVPDDFRVFTPTAVARMAKGVSGTLGLLLSLIAAISLIVSGVVISNVMVISVMERVSEIGLRRALGARKADITLQFLVETLMITLAGGSVGFLLGVIVAKGVSWFHDLPSMITWEPAMLALLLSGIIGLSSGLHPARRAARLDPAEALRL
jgi:putative ABC transport system permease protein